MKVLILICLVLGIGLWMPLKSLGQEAKQKKARKKKSDTPQERRKKKIEAVRARELIKPESAPGGNVFRKSWSALSGVKKIEKDLVYVEGGDSFQSLDVYLPEHAKGEKRPLVFYIHGGGWQSGDKAQFPYFMSLFAQKGYVGACINYRLSWQATYPGPIDDCTAALQYMVDNAEKYGIDTQNIFLMGGSAGGHLVSLLGTKNPVKDVKIRGVVSFFGAHNLNESGGAEEQPQRLIGGTREEKLELWKDGKARTHVSKDDPVFLLLHGDADNAVPLSESRNFKKALDAAGVPVTLKVYEGAGHGLTKKREPWADSYKRFKEIDQLVFAFLKKHTKTES